MKRFPVHVSVDDLASNIGFYSAVSGRYAANQPLAALGGMALKEHLAEIGRP